MDGNDDGQKGNSKGKPGPVSEAADKLLGGLAMGLAVLAAAKGVAETRRIIGMVMDDMENLEKVMDGESN